MLGTEIINGLYGVFLKNFNGYLTKKQAGKYDWKLLAKDVGYGVIAFGIGYSAKSILGLDLAEAQILNSAGYMLLTQLADKWFNAVYAKIKTWKAKTKFKFFG